MERRSFLKKAGVGLAAGAAVGLTACGKSEQTAAPAPAPAAPAAGLDAAGLIGLHLIHFSPATVGAGRGRVPHSLIVN